MLSAAKEEEAALQAVDDEDVQPQIYEEETKSVNSARSLEREV